MRDDLPRYQEDEPAHGRRTPAGMQEEQAECDRLLEDLFEERQSLWLVKLREPRDA